MPEAVEGYASVLERPEVMVVYIPLPTALRKEWVLKAAAAGKVGGRESLGRMSWVGLWSIHVSVLCCTPPHST